jgi:hypothetical protein
MVVPILHSYNEILTPTELAFLNGTRQFTKAQARYTRCRLNKKLRGLGAELSELQRLSGIVVGGCNAAAANERDGCNAAAKSCNGLSPTDSIQNLNDTLIHEGRGEAYTKERGSPRPARVGGNLVGRGIANPMSERTRGFELPRKKWNEIPTPRAIFPLKTSFSIIIISSNLTPYQARLSFILGLQLIPTFYHTTTTATITTATT